MISGAVNAQREAIVRLVVLDSYGREREIEAVVDTGYTGLLTLAPDLIAVLNLPLHGRGRAVLADGRETLFDIYEIEPDERGVIESATLPGLRLAVQKMIDGDDAEVLAELERRRPE